MLHYRIHHTQPQADIYIYIYIDYYLIMCQLHMHNSPIFINQVNPLIFQGCKSFSYVVKETFFSFIYFISFPDILNSVLLTDILDISNEIEYKNIWKTYKINKRKKVSFTT